MKKQLTSNRKKLDIDIWIIVICTSLTFFSYMLFAEQLMAYIKDVVNPVLLRLILVAGVQFGIAGLGITLVCLYRKQSFMSFGLIKNNTCRAIVGSVLCFVPYLIYLVLSGQFKGYHPLVYCLLMKF